MFQTASGVTIPFPDKIKEEFQLFDNRILFNISFEKLNCLIAEFIHKLQEPLYFVLELPLSQQEEAEIKIRTSKYQPVHKKVCYLDGQSKEQIKEIFHTHGHLLLNDGMAQFAVYSHISKDGIYIKKYKIATLFSNNPSTYVAFLEKYGLTQTNNIITTWDFFSPETPGEVRRVEINGLDSFDVYDELVKKGLYVAKIVED